MENDPVKIAQQPQAQTFICTTSGARTTMKVLEESGLFYVVQDESGKVHAIDKNECRIEAVSFLSVLR